MVVTVASFVVWKLSISHCREACGGWRRAQNVIECISEKWKYGLALVPDSIGFNLILNTILVSPNLSSSPFCASPNFSLRSRPRNSGPLNSAPLVTLSPYMECKLSPAVLRSPNCVPPQLITVDHCDDDRLTTSEAIPSVLLARPRGFWFAMLHST